MSSYWMSDYHTGLPVEPGSLAVVIVRNRCLCGLEESSATFTTKPQTQHLQVQLMPDGSKNGGDVKPYLQYPPREPGHQAKSQLTDRIVRVNNSTTIVLVSMPVCLPAN